MATLFVDKVDPQSGTSLEIGSSGDTITTATGAKPSFLNPSFQAFLSGDQTLSHDTTTVIAWDGETFDSDSDFDTSNYRFTPSVAGKYFVYVTCNIDVSAGFYYASSEVLKNGSTLPSARILNIFENLSSSDDSIEGIFLTYHGIVDMNGSSDYLTVNAYQASGNSGNIKGTRTIWGAYRILT
tara:strand:+ start:290 stop:838 length:549 start_codon:yes stop_codon:yes gene_type:complete